MAVTTPVRKLDALINLFVLCYLSFRLSQILQTGREINELDQSGFSTQGPTIFAGNLGSNKYILQVRNLLFKRRTRN